VLFRQFRDRGRTLMLLSLLLLFNHYPPRSPCCCRGKISDESSFLSGRKVLYVSNEKKDRIAARLGHYHKPVVYELIIIILTLSGQRWAALGL
jgi:hypothetical protein